MGELKLLLVIALLSLPLFSTGQMKYSTGQFNGLSYAHWDGPGDAIVVVIQGSGEYSTTTDGSDLYRFINKNSYAQYAASTIYPFDILVVAAYKKPGTDFPSQYLIMQNLAALVKTFNPPKVVLTGYSYGGQGTMGFKVEAANASGTTLYQGSSVFDGFISFCGQAPAIANWNANKDKPVFLVHGISDDLVPAKQSENIVNNHNAVNPKYRIYPNYSTTWQKDAYGKTVMTWIPKTVPDTATSRAIFIPTGEHGTAWQRGYNIKDDIGKQVYDFILKIITPKPKPVACTALLDTINMKAQFLLPTGKVYNANLIKP
jgi:hypothetical protein